MVRPDGSAYDNDRRPLPHSEPKMTTAIEVVRDFIGRLDAALRGGSENLYTLMDDDVTVWVNGTTPLSGYFRGTNPVRNILVATAKRRIVSGEVRILDHISETDKTGVFLEIRLRTHGGKIYNAAGDPAGCFFRVRDGRICEICFYPDTTQIETQIYGREFVPNAAAVQPH